MSKLNNEKRQNLHYTGSGLDSESKRQPQHQRFIAICLVTVIAGNARDQ
ncbi:hypothetical protein [Paraburkholderia diazotrophica]